MNINTLDLALMASQARLGDRTALKNLLHHFSIYQGWSPETERLRWDGAAALLNWWTCLEIKPPLDALSDEDGQRFIEAQSHLVRSTQKSYLKGARSALAALAWGLGKHCQPGQWTKVVLRPKMINLGTWDTRLFTHRIKIRLELLRTFLECGLSIPTACTLRWQDVDLQNQHIATAKRQIQLNNLAVEQLRQRVQPIPEADPSRLILGWKPETARGWVKLARKP